VKQDRSVDIVDDVFGISRQSICVEKKNANLEEVGIDLLRTRVVGRNELERSPMKELQPEFTENMLSAGGVKDLRQIFLI
jgi:hypothetical protein